MRPDLATIAGALIAAGAVVGGLLLEGGSLHDIAQYTAAIIVLGGTFGAVMVSTPQRTLLSAARRLGRVIFAPRVEPTALLNEIIGYAAKARKTGLVSLEPDIETASHPFLKKALILAVDGCDLLELRKMLELERDLEEARAEADARVYESAGGYAPTIGIIGAVLGLIQVMKRLADTEQVGHGIAVAFVATVYGVALANLFLLPAAAKIKARMEEETELRELMIEGVGGIVEGLNPKLIRSKLEAFAPGATAPGPKPAPAPGRAKEAA